MTIRGHDRSRFFTIFKDLLEVVAFKDTSQYVKTRMGKNVKKKKS